MENRVELVRQVVDDQVLRQQPNVEERRCGFVHLYGVAQACALLALKRGLDPELGMIAGMLHDVWNYKTVDLVEDNALGAAEAQRIMTDLGCFTEEEISVVGMAVLHHSDKGQVHGDFDELLKDADVLQHYLYNTTLKLPPFGPRLIRILDELGVEQV